MTPMIRIFIGFDDRETVAYHTFVQSLIDTSSAPLAITPLSLGNLSGYHERHGDGSNQFIYSRFLVPELTGYDGWALFADGDMVCRHDIAALWALRDERFAVQVVQHEYTTKQTTKYLGNVNQDYPRKNWSSLILWNCAHPANRVLTAAKVAANSGAFLHRFQWLRDQEVGALPAEWNWLAIEYDDNPNAKLIHYTLGTPCFRDYAQTSMSRHWHEAHARSLAGVEPKG
jgi:lipopolysaccharide biosynthesis glycosyltransferase